MAQWRGPFSLMITSRHEHAPNLGQALAVTRNVVLAMPYSRSVSPRSRQMLPRENRIGLPSCATSCGATRIRKISSRLAVSSRAIGAAAWALRTAGRWHRRRVRGLGAVPAWSGVWAERIISPRVCVDHNRSLAAAPQPTRVFVAAPTRTQKDCQSPTSARIITNFLLHTFHHFVMTS
jgi:hypothetical protein